MTDVSKCVEGCEGWVWGIVLVRDCRFCCEDGQRVGIVAMTLVLRVEVCMLEYLLSGGRKFFAESNRL